MSNDRPTIPPLSEDGMKFMIDMVMTFSRELDKALERDDLPSYMTAVVTALASGAIVLSLNDEKRLLQVLEISTAQVFELASALVNDMRADGRSKPDLRRQMMRGLDLAYKTKKRRSA